MTREKALEMINELPKEFNVDDFIEKMLFIEKVEKGFKSLDEGKTISHKEVKDIVQKMAEIIWSEDALADLESIHDYISLVSHLYADRQVAKIVRRISIFVNQAVDRKDCS